MAIRFIFLKFAAVLLVAGLFSLLCASLAYPKSALAIATGSPAIIDDVVVVGESHSSVDAVVQVRSLRPYRTRIIGMKGRHCCLEAVGLPIDLPAFGTIEFRVRIAPSAQRDGELKILTLKVYHSEGGELPVKIICKRMEQ